MAGLLELQRRRKRSHPRSVCCARRDLGCRVFARIFTPCTMRCHPLQRALRLPQSDRKPVGSGGSASVFRRFGGVVSARVLSLNLHGKASPAPASVRVDRLVIAGWTGRDKAAVEKHIEELAVLGVKRPPTTPVFYRASAARLTLDDEIEVLGETSSGEVEFVLLQHGGRLWVGTGSDHTDRQVEA